MPLPTRCLLIVALSTSILGCSSVQLRGPMPAASDPVGPLPPLEEAWSYDAEAGFGPSPALLRGDVLLLGTRQGELLALEVGEDVRSRGRVELGEAIEGRPATDGKTAYVPVATGKKGVRAYDLTRGSTRWSRSYGPHLAGLVLDEAADVLVAASHDGVLRGLDPATGDERWVFRPDSTFAAATGGRHYRAMPALLPGGLVAAVDDKGRLVALDVRTGSLAWSHDLAAPVYADLVGTPDGLLVSTTDGRLLAYDPDGAERWRYAAMPEVKLASAGVGEGFVVVGGTDGGLRLLDDRTGRVRWTFSTDGAIAAAPAVDEVAGRTLVYVGAMDNRVVGVDAETGEAVWEAELDGRVKTAPIVAPGGVLFFREPSEVVMFRAARMAATETRTD